MDVGSRLFNADQIFEITFTLIVLYLVLSRASGFSSAIRALGRVYVDAVKALQGR